MQIRSHFSIIILSLESSIGFTESSSPYKIDFINIPGNLICKTTKYLGKKSINPVNN